MGFPLTNHCGLVSHLDLFHPHLQYSLIRHRISDGACNYVHWWHCSSWGRPHLWKVQFISSCFLLAYNVHHMLHVLHLFLEWPNSKPYQVWTQYILSKPNPNSSETGLELLSFEPDSRTLEQTCENWNQHICSFHCWCHHQDSVWYLTVQRCQLVSLNRPYTFT